MKVYAAYYDNTVRMDSSSGGIFSLLSKKFNVVYGAALSEDCYECKFIRIEGDISPLRGSKYVEAKMGDIFIQVKKDLLDGKSVLFSGTGCQVNGLFFYLGKFYSNLYLLDLICHGVPSSLLWKKYVLYQEKKLGIGKCNSIRFRDKSEGWVEFGLKLDSFFSSRYTDFYMRLFLKNYCLRPSCYKCHAKEFKKSDITLGDFWGVDKICPEMYDNKGTSLVIIRTDKGEELFEKIRDTIICKEISYEDGVRYNSSEYKSAIKPALRDQFYNDLNNMEFEELVNKYIFNDD